MTYRGKKILFTFLTIFFGVMLVPAIATTVGTGGAIAFPIVVGCIFLLFLILAIYSRNQDQHYWPPKKATILEANKNDVIANDVYKKIKTSFPELPIKKAFAYNKSVFDKLHLECRKVAPTQFTIQSVANEMWRHMGLDTDVPTIYLVKRNETSSPFGKTDIAGLASTDYNERSLLITFNRGYSADSIICLLAHELAHFYQFDSNKVFSGPYGEIITDAMTAFFGFGNQFISGRKYEYSESAGLGSTIVHSGTIGYINDNDYKKILGLIDKNADILEDDGESNRLFIKSTCLSFKAMFSMKIQVAETNAKMPPIIGNYRKAGETYKEFANSFSISELESEVNALLNNYSKERFDTLYSFFLLEDILWKNMMPSDDKRK